MTNFEIIVDVNSNKALECLVYTAKDFLAEQMQVNQTLNTIFFKLKIRSALGISSRSSCFFVITPISDVKCKIAILSDYGDIQALSQGVVLQSLSDFLNAFTNYLTR